MSFSTLNLDCQLVIFAYLPVRAQLTFRLVCLAWCATLGEVLRHKSHLAIHTTDTIPRNGEPLRHHPNVLLSRAPTHQATATLCGRLCPSLRSLAFYPQYIDPPSVGAFFAQWPSLDKLTLGYADAAHNEPDYGSVQDALLTLVSPLQHLTVTLAPGKTSESRYWRENDRNVSIFAHLQTVSFFATECGTLAQLGPKLRYLQVGILHVDAKLSQHAFTHLDDPGVGARCLRSLSVRSVRVNGGKASKYRLRLVSQLLAGLVDAYPKLEQFTFLTEEHLMGYPLPPFGVITRTLSRFSHLTSLRLPTCLFLESLQPFWVSVPCAVLPTIITLHLYRFTEGNCLFTSLSGASIGARLGAVFPTLKRLTVHLPADQSTDFFTDTVRPHLGNIQLTFATI